VKKQETVRGTVKVSVLRGDPDCPSLVAASVYDTKPVHFLSMVSEVIEWIVKSRLVYNPDSERQEHMRFLRLNLNDGYNNNMGHVDVSDQLRNTYRFDHWLRQWKWWWAIWLWALGVMLVNAFAAYQMVMEENGIPRSRMMSQYDFRRAIALAWVSSNEESISARQRGKEARKRKAEDEELSTAATTSGKGASSRKRRKTTDNASNKGSAVEVTQKPERAPTLKDNILLNTTGPLSQRLNNFIDHWPTELEDRGARCAVHRWCADIEVKAHVFKCSHCRINLCIDCFRVFHSKTDLVGYKEELKRKFVAQQQAKLNMKTAPSLYAKKPTKK
jgi:hypothetical protein